MNENGAFRPRLCGVFGVWSVWIGIKEANSNPCKEGILRSGYEINRCKRCAEATLLQSDLAQVAG